MLLQVGGGACACSDESEVVRQLDEMILCREDFVICSSRGVVMHMSAISQMQDVGMPCRREMTADVTAQCSRGMMEDEVGPRFPFCTRGSIVS